MTVAQLQRQSSLSRRQLHRYWDNQVKRPNPTMLDELATILHVDPAALLFRPEEEADRD